MALADDGVRHGDVPADDPAPMPALRSRAVIARTEIVPQSPAPAGAARKDRRSGSYIPPHGTVKPGRPDRATDRAGVAWWPGAAGAEIRQSPRTASLRRAAIEEGPGNQKARRRAANSGLLSGFLVPEYPRTSRSAPFRSLGWVAMRPAGIVKNSRFSKVVSEERLATPAGIEPATVSLEGCCSIR
jgi:hypothetical protein